MIYIKYSVKLCPITRRFKYAMVLTPPTIASPNPIKNINNLKITLTLPLPQKKII
jgi:hypothetical protein